MQYPARPIISHVRYPFEALSRLLHELLAPTITGRYEEAVAGANDFLRRFDLLVTAGGLDLHDRAIMLDVKDMYASLN